MNTTTTTTTTTTNKISTVDVKIINEATMEEILNPVYECHSFEKFQEFVAWYRANTRVGQIAIIRGFALGGRQVYVETILGKRY